MNSDDVTDPTRPIRVLLVEDSPGDVRLSQEAFRSANMSIQLSLAADGVDAMAMLNREGEYANAPRSRAARTKPATSEGRSGGSRRT